MKAIETIYKGHRFRSRLEARWAVFFDALDIRWEYEKEGYDLDGLWYLPDFYLPDHKYWIEVKGREPTEDDWEKVLRLAAHVDKDTNVYLFGDLPLIDGNGNLLDYGVYQMIQNEYGEIEPFQGLFWAVCPICLTTSLIWEPDGSGTNGGERCTCLHQLYLTLFHSLGMEAKHHEHRDTSAWFKQALSLFTIHNSPSVIAAYRTARMARFEHGRSGN